MWSKSHSSPWAKELYSICKEADKLYISTGIICAIMLTALKISFNNIFKAKIRNVCAYQTELWLWTVCYTLSIQKLTIFSWTFESWYLANEVGQFKNIAEEQLWFELSAKWVPFYFALYNQWLKRVTGLWNQLTKPWIFLCWDEQKQFNFDNFKICYLYLTELEKTKG